MRAIRYALDEALASLWRGRRSGVLSTLTIALALFVLGGFLLVAANLERLGAGWTSAAEMSVYLEDGASEAERGAIERAIAAEPAVLGREFVSKAEALRRFRRTFGELGAALDSVGDNPLPASFELRVAAGPDARSSLERLAETLRQLPGVTDVRDDRLWMDRLARLSTLLRGIGLALGSVLALAAALTVASVVRLALHARRDELEIMRLVGAPSAYVRGPFLVEGVIQGGAGAAMALAALGAGYLMLRSRYLAPLASAADLSALGFLPWQLSVLLVAGGMVVGGIGGAVAAWSGPDGAPR